MKNNLLQILKHPILSIKYPGSVLHPYTWCNDAYLDYLRSKGAIIGENTRFISPRNCHVDINRASYISIGNNCCLSVVTILAHDYSWYTLLDAFHEVLPDSGGRVKIGNNCFIGYETVILKNTEIGDNVIIGARSVVKGVIPPNTVWAGVPAKQICTLEDYFHKRYKSRLSDAKYRRNFIRESQGREPKIEDMGLFGMLFLKRTKDNFEHYIKSIEFNGIKDNPAIKHYFFNSSPLFPSFEDFLKLD